MAITKGKKGFMFTLVTIFLISIFVFILYSRSSNVMMDQQEATAERTEAIVVNLFTQTLTDYYLTNIAKVASANAIRAMVIYINQTRTPITDQDPEDFFKEIVVNGTISGMYEVTEGTNYVAMQIEILNGTQEITYQTPSATGHMAAFGDNVSIVQKINIIEDELEDIQQITINVTNQNAASGNVDLYLALYNDSSEGSLLMLNHQIVDILAGTAQEITFSIDGINPLNEITSYYVMLSAPFTNEEDDYSIDISTSSNQLVVENYQSWRLGDTGNNNKIPLDFYLQYSVIGEGFLRQLMNSFESLGKEKLNIDTSINLTSLTVNEDVWEIGINATFIVNTHKTTVSFSNIPAEGIASTSIIGMYDPLSILRSDILSEERQYVQIIEQNVSEDFDEEDMYRHLSEQTFVFNEEAPSFLGRFAGIDAVSSNCCGIQTVYLPEHVSSVDEYDYSYVDYMFRISNQCQADGSNPIYYIVSATGALSDLTGSDSPLFDYSSIEFYHLDEMSDVTVGLASCPTS